MPKLSLTFIFLMVTVMAVAACSPKTTPPAAVAATFEPDVLIAEGRLLPANSLEHSFSIPGQVAEVLVKEGEDVKVGQVLARLQDSPEAQLALARAQQEMLSAQLALGELKAAAEMNLAQGRLAVIAAQKQLEAAQEKMDSDASAANRAELDAAAAGLNRTEDTQAKLEAGAGVDPDKLAAAEAFLAAAKAAVASAQAAVDALELKAAMDGTLVDITLQAGQRVSAGHPVMTLADFSSWVVKTDNLTEVEVINLKVGQEVEMILDALPAAALRGEVTHIDARFEEKRGDITYTVTILLNQTDPLMRWGMTAAVQFVP